MVVPHFNEIVRKEEVLNHRQRLIVHDWAAQKKRVADRVERRRRLHDNQRKLGPQQRKGARDFLERRSDRIANVQKQKMELRSFFELGQVRLLGAPARLIMENQRVDLREVQARDREMERRQKEKKSRVGIWNGGGQEHGLGFLFSPSSS